MKSTGIYLANGTVRVAEVTGSRRRPRLLRVAVVPVPPEREVGEVLAETLRESSISTSRVCVSLAGERAVVRRLVIPVSNPRAAQKVVRFQAEELLCAESLEDVIVEHEVVGPAPGGGTEILVLIVRKSEVSSALSALAAAGIQGAAVTLDGVALFNLAGAARGLPEKGRAALLDCDGPVLRILVARDGMLEVFRVARPAEGDGTGGVSGQGAVRELERTLAGADIRDPLEKILVTGAVGEETVRNLSGRFLTPVEVLDAGKALGGGEMEGALSASVATGAALKGLNAETLAMDFRKEEFAPKGEFRKAYYLGLYALGALALLFGILLAGAVRRLDVASGNLERLTREEKKYWKKVFPTKDFPRVKFDHYITSLKRKRPAREAGEIRYGSFLDVLKRIAESSPGEGIQVQAITFDQQKVILAGEVDTIDRFESLRNNLQARFGVRVKPSMERRKGRREEARTLFKIEIPRAKEVR